MGPLKSIQKNIVLSEIFLHILHHSLQPNSHLSLLISISSIYELSSAISKHSRRIESSAFFLSSRRFFYLKIIVLFDFNMGLRSWVLRGTTKITLLFDIQLYIAFLFVNLETLLAPYVVMFGEKDGIYRFGDHSNSLDKIYFWKICHLFYLQMIKISHIL